MALPQQVVERLGREQVDTPGWSSRLLMFSGTIFFVGLAVYLGLIFGYKPYLEKQVADLDAQIANFSLQIPPEEQNKLIYFYSQVVNLQEILNHHIISSQTLAWLEKNTEANVYYDRLTWSAFPSSGPGSNQFGISGFAKTSDDFSKQISVFQANPLVKNIDINSLTLSTNNLWRFEINLLVTNDVFKQ